jgi:hypothetical protein
MYLTYRFSNFKEISNVEGKIIFENDLTAIAPVPAYLKLSLEE